MIVLFKNTQLGCNVHKICQFHYKFEMFSRKIIFSNIVIKTAADVTQHIKKNTLHQHFLLDFLETS